MFPLSRSTKASRPTSWLWLILAALLIGGPPVCFAQATAGNETCAGCHDVGAKVSKSAHAKVGCAQCHAKHEEYPHPANQPKPACASCHASQAGDHAASVHGQELKKGNAGAPNCDSCHGTAHELLPARTADFRKAVPQTCGLCHNEVQQKFEKSVHGTAVAKGIFEAPVCTDCHGEHAIQRPKDQNSLVNAGHIRETCGRCHGDVRLMRQFGLPGDRLTSFDASFHGLAAKTGSQTVANCASCHGFHDILPSSDAHSRTNAKSLAATCGACHPGAGTRFALGKIHVDEAVAPVAWIGYIRSFYLVLIPAVIGLMLLHHLGDFARKFARLRGLGGLKGVSPPDPQHAELRMYPFERFQHALLATSFLTLVWSGFALKYPNQWWAVPMESVPQWAHYRGVIHRVAGVIMIIAGVIHLISLLRSRRLRLHWMTLIPRRRDLTEAYQNFLYNLFLRRSKPQIGSHSYIEKAEYWAVVWGTIVMALTGILLWANNWSLQNLPKFVLDLATTLHFYEALLATLAIVVWHFYSVIFDPDVYPMDTAWLTGKSPRHHSPHTTEAINVESPAQQTARVDETDRLPVK